MIAPLALGSSLAFWDMRRSVGSRRAYRRSLIAVVGVQVLATVALSVCVVLTRTSWWIVPVFVVAGIALTAGAVWLGPILRRAEKKSDRPTTASVAYPRANLRRDVRRIVIAGVIGLIVGGAATLVLFLVFGEGRQPGTWDVLVLATAFGALAAGIGCALVTRRLAREVRGLVDGDVERARLIGRVVVRGKRTTLAPDDEAVAPRFAALSCVVQAYQIAWLVCLYVALGGQQILRVMDEPGDMLAWSLLIFFAVMVVTLGPVIVVQLRRTRRYALEHGEAITEARESSAGVPADS
ncbi:hypothetical protein [Microbacterium sp. 1.5R]|uniref:hypothetical protein n=1 Tax=Microbacterium sp. 1.5R TaxID=1916917 RepID=UPI0011A3BF7E|nr:hypothetical protein [Microbacterium sp. 1.5R]